jgi:3-dehydroquinate dehydratase/shikimate dehydrogenase
MESGGICVPVCASTAAELIEKVEAAAGVADLVEVRFDCLEKSELLEALDSLPDIDRTYIFTYRPDTEGGRQELNLHERHNFWERIADDPPVTNFLGDVELGAEFPVKLRPDLMIASRHDFEGDETLDRTLFQTASGIVKIAVTVNDAAGAVDVWKLIETARSVGKRVIPIAMGEAGKWTRILGLAHGAFLTYASLFPAEATAVGQLTVGEMIETFRVREIGPDTRVYGILAGNTTYSMSPYIHNAAFREAAVDSVFVPFQTNDLAAFFRRLVSRESRETELNLGGFSVTNPHKQSVMRFIDEMDDAASAIGAVNTIKIEDDRLFGFNTDAEGFIRPLRDRRGDLHGARAAVVGGGGAARACAYALKRDGADVSVFTRRTEQSKQLAADLDVNCFDLADCSGNGGYDILVNATPLGTHGEDENAAISDVFPLKDVKLVYDLVYNPAETKLLRAAEEAGVETLGGLEMLIGQAVEQFKIWTGREAPVDAMKRAALDRLLLFR